MRPNKRRKLILLTLSVGIVLCVVRFIGEYDVRALTHERKPSFTYSSAFLLDGGSTEYYGIGYTVSYLHRISGVTENGTVYRVGPLLEFWMPIPGILPTRDFTHTYVRTNK